MFTLDRIKPFNKCFYYNCVHSCIFAIIEANGGDFRKIMLSGVPHFAVDNDTQRIYTRFDFLENYEHLLLEQGIIAESFALMDADECMGYVIKSLRDNKPVIINVDCYELTYRDDLFHKGEWPHSLLVFGHNDDTDSFHVIDQLTRDDVVFRQFDISGNALKRAAECYNKNRKNSQMYFGDMVASFECRYPGKIYDSNTLFSEWCDCRKKVQDHIANGILKVKEQLEKLVEHLPEETFRTMYGESILEGLNDIVKQKRWESFLLNELLFEKNALYMLHLELLQKWILLRKKIALVIMSSRQREKTMDSITEMIYSLFMLEKQFDLSMTGENINENRN